MFILYTTPLKQIILKYGICYHKYADDTQLYLVYDLALPGDRERALSRLTACIQEIRVWMAQWWLKLNEDKTEMVIFVSKHHLKKYGETSITIGESCVNPVRDVRNLGVQMDQHMTMVQQVTAVCASCNYHLYRISSIRQYLTTEATKSAVHALIMSRMDYCNSLLTNIIERYQ